MSFSFTSNQIFAGVEVTLLELVQFYTVYVNIDANNNSTQATNSLKKVCVKYVLRSQIIQCKRTFCFAYNRHGSSVVLIIRIQRLSAFNNKRVQIERAIVHGSLLTFICTYLPDSALFNYKYKL